MITDPRSWRSPDELDGRRSVDQAGGFESSEIEDGCPPTRPKTKNGVLILSRFFTNFDTPCRVVYLSPAAQHDNWLAWLSETGSLLSYFSARLTSAHVLPRSLDSDRIEHVIAGPVIYLLRRTLVYQLVLASDLLSQLLISSSHLAVV